MQPHPVLAEHYPDGAGKRAFLTSLFDKGAPFYDTACRIGFFGTGLQYRQMALKRAGLRKGMKLLDVATGTGLVARAASNILGGADDITCVDPSPGMLAEARKNLSCTMLEGVADDLPVQDAGFDFLSMGYALRHVASLKQAFSEYHRALKPGGKLMILEVSKPASALGMIIAKAYFGGCVPAAARLLTGSPDAGKMMSYYWETIEQCVAPSLIIESLEKAGFLRVKRMARMGIFSEYTAEKA